MAESKLILSTHYFHIQATISDNPTKCDSLRQYPTISDHKKKPPHKMRRFRFGLGQTRQGLPISLIGEGEKYLSLSTMPKLSGKLSSSSREK